MASFMQGNWGNLYLKVGLFDLIPSYADFVVELQD